MPELASATVKHLFFHLLQSSASTKIFVFPQIQEMISSYFLTLIADFSLIFLHTFCEKKQKKVGHFFQFYEEIFIFIYTTWINKNTHWLLSQLNK